MYAASIGGGGNESKMILFDGDGKKLAVGRGDPYKWSFAKT
jgi:hypothetical protein